MLQQKTRSFLLSGLIIIVAGLASGLMISANRTTAQAQIGNRERGGVYSKVPSLSLVNPLVTDPFLTSQAVFTQPRTLQAPENTGQDNSRGVSGPARLARQGIGAQSTGGGYELVPASAFRHDGFPPADGYRFWPTAGYIRNKSAFVVCVAAPVYLPHGATITGLWMFFVDDHPTLQMWTGILRRNRLGSPAGAAGQRVVGVEFLLTEPPLDSPEPFYAYEPAIAPGTAIVNNNYSYTLTYCFDANTNLDHLLYSFEVDYIP